MDEAPWSFATMFGSSETIARSVSKLISVWITSGELEIMRRSYAAGQMAGAPNTTISANTHFATYRLDKKDRPGNKLSFDALGQIFGYLASVVSGGRTRPAHGDCISRILTTTVCGWPVVQSGLLKLSVHTVPKRSNPSAVQAAPEPSTPDPLPAVVEDTTVPPGPSIHTTVSRLCGVDLLHDPEDGPDAVPLAVRYLPEIEQRLFWQNSVKNVKAAIQGRIIDPHVSMTMSDADIADMKQITDVLCKSVENDHKHIMTIIQDVLGITGWKSNKWSHKRAETCLNQLFATYAPRYQFCAAIKLEPSKHGKAPRLLVADGDKGQVMAWVLIGVLERWLIRRYKQRSIKGLPKMEAMQRVIEHLRMKHPTDDGMQGPDVPVAVVENDGSAWDSCMSADLRAITENPVMEAIAKLVEQCFVPAGAAPHTDARVASNKLVKLQLNFRKDKSSDKTETFDLPKGKCWQFYIPAIRRSGCRGTSILNFLSNMVCWCWVIGGANAVKLIQPQGSKIVCVDGVIRWVKMAFEGDDSILSFFARNCNLTMTDLFMDMMHDRWVKLGHRPKLFWRKEKSRAEFCGWHFAVLEEGLDRTCAPDLVRNLINMAYSINAAAVTAAIAGDHDSFMKAVAPGIISRLYPLASKYPTLCDTISQQFVRYTSQVVSTDLTRDEIYSLQLEPEDFGFKESDYYADMDGAISRAAQRFRPILERYREQLAQGDSVQERKLAVQMSVVRTEDCYSSLIELLAGAFRIGGDGDIFRDAVLGLLIKH